MSTVGDSVRRMSDGSSVRRVLSTTAAEEDDGLIGLFAQDDPGHLRPRQSRHVVIQDDEVRLTLPPRPHRLVPVDGLGDDLQPVVGGLDGLAQQPPDRFVVVSDQDAGHVAVPSTPHARADRPRSPAIDTPTAPSDLRQSQQRPGSWVRNAPH
jgi:hypothetical protein